MQLRKRYILSVFSIQNLNQPSDLMWIIMKCFCSNAIWSRNEKLFLVWSFPWLNITWFILCFFQAESKQRHPKPSAVRPHFSLMFFRNRFWVVFHNRQKVWVMKKGGIKMKDRLRKTGNVLTWCTCLFKIAVWRQCTKKKYMNTK